MSIKRNSRLYLFGIPLLIVSGLFFVSCSPRGATQDKQSVTTQNYLSLSTSTDPKTFNPIISQETSSTQILQYLFEGLTTTDPRTGGVLPNLATSWQHDDTGLIWTVALRNDVVWSDGVPFTSADVLFTFNEIIYNPDIVTGLKSIFVLNGQPIEVTAVDEHHLRFVLPSKFAPFVRSLGFAIMPKHVLEESVKNGSFNEIWGIKTNPQEIVGTGPFLLDQYYPGERVVLKKNERYWKSTPDGDSLPRLSGIVFSIIQSPDIALLKFKNGEIDLYGVRGIDYPWLKKLEVKKTGDFTIYELGPAMSKSFLTFNQNDRVNEKTNKPYIPEYKQKWFSDILFRKAIAHAVNTDHIIELVYNGLGIKQHAVMSPASGFFYTDDVVMYDYDVSKAREILTDAGYVDRDDDGVREDTEGHKVEFNFYIGAGTPQSAQLANLVRKDLSLVGIKTNLLQLEFNTLVNKLSFTYDWDMVMIGLTGGVEPHFGANVWLSSSPLHLWNPRQIEPATEWEGRVDDIYTRGVQELDSAKRKVLYDEWQRLVSEELPVIYTVIPLRYMAVNDRLGNINPTPLGGVLHNIEEIYVKSFNWHTGPYEKND